ncbi:MAG: hypothetical protein C5B50_24455 [Verrucomicrobia bacterium]|nr:MAG: hypothetical protein C5B50_24455 [Verrucomicrobiota bacterium]
MLTSELQQSPTPAAGHEKRTSKRVLEPIERISEVLFGLIMVLTFTCTFSVAESGREEIRNMFLAALGCNLAWGVIDAVMYLMGCLAERARSLAVLRGVRGVADAQKAQRVIADALPPPFKSAVGPQELEAIHRRLSSLPEPPSSPRLTGRDYIGATGVFLLVVISTLPVVLPFLLIHNTMRAQRVSNAVAIVLMFLTGYAFGRCSGYHPRTMGFIMVAVGGVLVGLTIVLGG